MIEDNPLVSVVMTTYNSGEMLCDYSLPSVVNQKYKNLEIIVIDDGSIDDTEERISLVKDSRIVYIKIPHTENSNWYATGVVALNHGLSLCNGFYIAHLDSDDWFLPEKIETLVNFNKDFNADIIYHPFLIHYPNYETFKRVYMEALSCSHGNITTSSLFYKSKYKHITFGDLSNILPGDWLKTKGILGAGGIPARCPDMLLLKSGYRECSSFSNRLYRPMLEPEPYRNIRWDEDQKNA